MARAKLTSKGQITIPKAVRERLNIEPGDRLVFREQPDGSIVIEAETADVLALAGTLKSRVRRVTVDDMSDAASGGALVRYKRSTRK
jgi:AbrB family looped-hinge helix DNA binding protein